MWVRVCHGHLSQVVGTWLGSSVVRAPPPRVWGGPRFNPWPCHFCASNITTYFDKLQAMEVPIAESLQKMILINALPRALDHLVTALLAVVDEKNSYYSLHYTTLNRQI